MSNYNLNISIDEQLRDVPEKHQDVSNYILEEKEKLKSISEPAERVKILGRVGSFVRILGELDDAKALLTEAVELINEYKLGSKLLTANKIRLAHVYQWMGHFDIAEEMFSNIVQMCEEKKEVSSYLHFALQHFGKLYFDLGEYQKALKYFENAMDIRKKVDDSSLIRSSQFAIDITKKRLKADSF